MFSAPRFADRFSTVTSLGRGGSGRVDLVHRTADGAAFAVKWVRPRSEATHVRFAREQRLLLALRHPNLVRVHEVGWEGDDGYLLMDFLAGGTLREQVAAHGALPPDAVASLVREAADGLAALHEASIVHRDVKPSNLLFGLDGRLRIGDLGCATDDATTGVTRPGDTLGTPRFMAPEQRLDARAADPRADEYALAVTALFALCGRVAPDVFLAERREAALATLPEPIALALRPSLDPDRRGRRGDVRRLAEALASASRP